MIQVHPQFQRQSDLRKILDERISAKIKEFFRDAYMRVALATPQDSGDAARSLRMQTERFAGKLWYEKPYVAYPEFGTVYQAPQEFFWTSIAKSRAAHSLKKVNIDD